MRPELASDLRSPDSGNPLRLQVFQGTGDDVVDGRLVDDATGEWFRIEHGIADLAPARLRRADRDAAFCERYGLGRRPAGPESVAPAKAYADQIRFFRDYQSQYEDDVVASPFYEVLDEVTLGGWIRRMLAPDARVVEIGCGSGRQTLPMLEHGCRVIAVDLSEEMLRAAREKALRRGHERAAEFIVGSADALPLRSALGDAAVVFGSLHHFPDPEASLREAGRVLRPGGRFYMLEPHDSMLRPLFEWSMKLWTLWKEEAADEPLFTAAQWNAWLGAAGISAEIRYSTYLPPHLFYALRGRAGRTMLAASDRLLGSLPGVRKLAGIIIAEGVRQA